MKFKAEIEILPKKGLLDPQGKAVLQSIPRIGADNVTDVSVGRFITLEIDAENASKAEETAELASKKLLANLIMESYNIRISEL